MRRVTLYGRAGCHLCHDAREDLRLLEGELDLDVVEVDISTDERLVELYEFLIPVLEIENGPLLTAPLTLSAMRAALQA